MHYKIRDTSHLLDIIDTIKKKGYLTKLLLVLFDIVNMFLSTDNVKGMDAVRLVLNKRDSNKPSTECVLEGLENCIITILYLLKTIFYKQMELQQVS